MRIALAGNPNSGKTSMYNLLTGRSEKVGNWAGVTVDKKENSIKKSFYKGEELIVVDLPGAYSMSPFTSEESITSAYVKNENPDVIINIVDSTNLSRSLFFTTQLLELGVPVVVALNKSDLNEKKETQIDTAKLSQKLGCPIIQTVCTTSKKNGLSEVVRMAVSLKGKGQKAPYTQDEVDMNSKEAVLAADKARFNFVKEIVSEVENRKVYTKDRTFQDKIDKMITSKWLGIPVFALIMFLVFDISQSTFGPWVADSLVAWLEETGILANLVSEDVAAGLLAIDWQGKGNELISVLAVGVGGMAQVAVGAVSATVSGVAKFLIGLIFAIYLLLGKEKLGSQLERMMEHYLD